MAQVFPCGFCVISKNTFFHRAPPVTASKLFRVQSYLQKVYEIIHEIPVSKTLCGFFLIFCRSCFIYNLLSKINLEIIKSLIFTIPQDRFILRKLLHIVLKILSVQIGWKDLFQKNFQGLWDFFTNANSLVWASFFCTKNDFYTFFQVWLFHFNIIFITGF